MGTRLELQSKLEELLGGRNVYYQPPETLKMIYPCIVYSLDDIYTDHANNSAYSKHRRYQIIVIDRKPDHAVIDRLLELPYCSYDRHYVSDNLNHDVFTIFY